MNRSEKILHKPDWGFNRSVFKAMGYSDNDLEGPVIGIANAWNDLVPGHTNLRELANFVRKGIYKQAEAWPSSVSLALVTAQRKAMLVCIIFCRPVT